LVLVFTPAVNPADSISLSFTSNHYITLNLLSTFMLQNRMGGQLDLFKEVKLEEPEPLTTVKVGNGAAQIPLRRKRREAISRLMKILADLEGKDIYIGSYDAGGRHFWLDNLKLPRLKLDFHPTRFRDDHNYIPSMIVLWGNRAAQVRIFTDHLVGRPGAGVSGLLALLTGLPQRLLGKPDRQLQVSLCLPAHHQIQRLKKGG
jgi:hypothetical protein